MTTQQRIQAARERGRRLGRASQAAQQHERLAGVIERLPVDCLVLEILTHNPRNGVEHVLELRHAAYGGTDRYDVVVDGVRWRNGWSRTRFCAWLFERIDSVRREWG